MDSRTFHLGDILSVTTGFLVAPGHIAAVHELLEYMASEPVWTHQLPRVADECKPELLRQHPDLAGAVVPVSFDGKEHVDVWLDEQVARFGEFREVTPLAREDHTPIDPLSEMAMNFPHMEVVTIVVPGGDVR